jgi:cardiolipin synthase
LNCPLLKKTLKPFNSTMNIPNIVSITRILITPFFVILLIKKMFFFALLVFALAGISDALDGLLARYFNQHTILGSYLDPLADKLLLTSAFVSLAILKVVPGWLTVIVITRDVLIFLGIAMIAIMGKKIAIKPSLVSKCTTVVQLLTIFLILLDNQFAIREWVILWPFYWITAFLTITSGLDYIIKGLKMLQESSANNR